MASIALGLTCLGCLLLSLSLRRHYRQVFGEESRYAQRCWPLRLGGYALVMLALWPATLATTPAIGPTLWLSVLALAAFLQIMLLTYRPRWAMALGAFGLMLMGAGAIP